MLLSGSNRKEWEREQYGETREGEMDNAYIAHVKEKNIYNFLSQNVNWNGNFEDPNVDGRGQY
jgi:hypothetical protein